jgi:hypothetical protein
MACAQKEGVGKWAVRVGIILSGLMFASTVFAGVTRNADHLVPTGKGWGEANANPHRNPPATSPSGISYHGGPIMPGSVNAYFIWYGNWSSGPKPSDSGSTVSLLSNLFGPGGIGGSGYELINTTYGAAGGSISGAIGLGGDTTDNYSQGTKLSDSRVAAVVSTALRGAKIPIDPNGVYFVLTSSDVSESSGFCTSYCGWHSHAALNGADIKYAFVGNPDRCPMACEAQAIGPNNDTGGDAMASVVAHEAEEMTTDPDLNAWYDSTGQENADKCAWKFGPVANTSNGAIFNQTFNGLHWLIQMNWENSGGGGCAQTLGGPFYTY